MKSQASSIESNIASIMISTTLRVFVPSIIGIGLGVWADLTHHQRPWFTLIGLFVGLTVAGLLIAQEIKKITKQSS